MRIHENIFDIGWQESTACRVYGTRRYVYATNLNSMFAPPNLKIALAGNNPDNKHGVLLMMKNMTVLKI